LVPVLAAENGFAIAPLVETANIEGPFTRERKENTIPTSCQRRPLCQPIQITGQHPNRTGLMLRPMKPSRPAAAIRDAVKALIIANEFLEAQVWELQAAVSNGYARGRFEPVPRDRKDWYD
jgi:hypothetical protein